MCNPLHPELNPICHLLVFLKAHHILHVSRIKVNPSNAELNPICHLLVFLKAHHILHISRIWVLLICKQGLRHIPQMHRSLGAYCATLGPP